MSTDANARAPRPSLGHIPGLDGIRALSVLAIIAFHTGLNSVPGGYYGVDAFFVLSGFLITSLLVKEWGGTGTIRLRRFWAGRARRLLPALFLLIIVMGIVMAVVPTLLQAPHMLGYAFASVFYFSNWYSVHNGVTYFSGTGQSPLLHTWSLAIEEQFYLVWPLVVLAVLKLGRGRWFAWRGAGGSSSRRPARAAGSGRTVDVLGGGTLVLRPAPAAARLDPEWQRRRRLQVLFGVACFGSLASALAMVFLAPNGYTTRAYYGTDCRAQALLVGAAISIGLTLWREGSQRRWFSVSAGFLGVIGAAGTAALWMTTSEYSTFAFSGGFLVASMAAGAVVLACAVAPRSLVVRILELPPLPQWGRISYGMYLWYWPVLLVMTGQRLHWGVYPLFLARVGITVAIAALSYDLVEMPIRRGALKNWRSWVAAPVGAAAAIAAVFISTLVPVGATELQGQPIDIQSATTTTTTAPPTTTTHPAVGGGASTTTTVAPTTTTTAPPPPTYLSLPLPPPTGKADKPIKVLLVGDSIAGTLGVGLAQYASAAHYKVQIANEGNPGCSLSMQQQIKTLWYTLAPGPPCSATNPDVLFTTWRKWVDEYNPDVVLYVARGETFNQEVNGSWQNLGQASFDSYLADRYREAVSVLGSKGATVVLMTSPYYDSGTSPSGGPWPEDVPARVQIDNSTIHEVASTATTGTGTSLDGKVYVFDLNTVVDPGNRYDASIGQVNIRCGDGVHFSASGGIYVGLRLMPDLVALGQGHAVGSPGGALAGDDASIDPVVVPEPALPVEPPGVGAGDGAGDAFVTPVVRRATAADVDGMAAQLAKTFWDDPVTSHIFRRGGDRRRNAGLRAYFATQMRADYLPFGGCYTTDGYAGSAIWAPAGKPLLTGPTAVLTMLPVLPYVWDRLPTTLGILNKMESLHPHEPHWYLASLGTAVELQGKGVGSALMQPVLAHCDAVGLPCYLESSKERNVPFYRRHGFEVVREVPLPDDGPSIWTMWRDPQPLH